MSLAKLLVSFALAALAVLNAGTITTYYGIDPGVGPGGPWPVSIGARLSFMAAVAGPANLVTFESMSNGAIAPGTAIGPGSTLTTTNVYGINDTQNVITGFNTTPGGSRYLWYWTNSATNSAVFSYADPISFWGAFFTGVGTDTGTVHVQFDDGVARDYSIAGSINGGVLFWGFTDTTANISSVAISLLRGTGDVFGVDCVTYGSAVPEPGGLLLLAIGVALIAARKLHR